MKPVCIYVLVISLNFVFCQYSNSPCPSDFEFETDGDSVYGKFILRPSGDSVSSLLVRINFTVAAQVFSNYVGHVEAEDNFLLLQKYNLGLPISYRVHFPVPSPLPKLTSLTVNGKKVCYGPGDGPRPNNEVTAVFLQHTFLPGGGPVYTNVQPQQQPQSIPNPTPLRPDSSSSDVVNNDNNDGVFQRPNRPTFDQNQILTNQPVPTERPVERQTDSSYTSNTECGVVADDNENSPLFYSGKSYARGDIPWLVAIYKVKSQALRLICGGTLVSNRHVVTAAVCMRRRNDYSSIDDFVVKIGVHDLNNWSDDIVVTRFLTSATIHESYNPATLENDILVFTLNKNVEFNKYIRPACLWTGNADLSYVVGATGIFAGWSELGVKDKSGLAEPHRLRMPIVSTRACRASRPEFQQLTSNYTLCAGDRNGEGPCTGDSGCGLYIREGGKWRLRGVVSVSLRAENGDPTCNLNEYVVFTDTAQYLSWIRNVIFQTLYE